VDLCAVPCIASSIFPFHLSTLDTPNRRKNRRVNDEKEKCESLMTTYQYMDSR
jgi:hypothetical protein